MFLDSIVGISITLGIIGGYLLWNLNSYWKKRYVSIRLEAKHHYVVLHWPEGHPKAGETHVLLRTTYPDGHIYFHPVDAGGDDMVQQIAGLQINDIITDKTIKGVGDK